MSKCQIAKKRYYAYDKILLFNSPTDTITQKMTGVMRRGRDSERRANQKMGINRITHNITTSGFAWPLYNIAKEVTVSHGTHMKGRVETSWTLGVHHKLNRNPSPDNVVTTKSCELARKLAKKVR
jgi:hypothetical protein